MPICNHVEVEIDGAIYCKECCEMLDGVVFEKVECNGKTKSRINAYNKFLLRHGISGFEYFTLMDTFPKIEVSYLSSGRKNFINLEQLTVILLEYSGYPNIYGLNEFKTKTRKRQAYDIVDKCLAEYYGAYLKPNGDRSKSIGDRHCYTHLCEEEYENSNTIYTDKEKIDHFCNSKIFIK